MPSNLTCARCGRAMGTSSASLPQGEATCHPCRRKSPAYLDRQAAKSAPREYGEAECPVCNMAFTKGRASQVYCSASCRESRRNWSYATKAASADERGYGKAHRAERARWKPIVESGQAACCICGYDIEPSDAWHLDHNEDRTGYRGVAHAECNVRDGASRGARRVNANRPRLAKACTTCGSWFTTIYPRQAYCSAACRPKSKAKPKAVATPCYCTDCGARLARHGKRCTACWRVEARNEYRRRVGIPLDAPLYSRAG